MAAVGQLRQPIIRAGTDRMNDDVEEHDINDPEAPHHERSEERRVGKDGR